MGIDIHLHITRRKELIKENIFDGRNSEWFANLQKEGWDDTYDTLPINRGIPKDVPEKIQKAWDLRAEGYYGFCYMTVNEFRNWFLKYRPDIDAGWVSTYDKWRIEKKGYIPDDIKHYLDKDDKIQDMHFIEITNPYDCSAWLYQYLTEAEDIEPTDLLVYYFDC